MAARKLVVYKEFTAQLVKFEEEYGSLLVDCSTPKGMVAAKASRKEIRDTRSNLEDLRKETKAPVLAKAKQVDDEAKAIKVRLDVLFIKFDGKIKEVENAAEIAKQKKVDQATAKLQELEGREEAIKAKEIELGLREPDKDDDRDITNDINHSSDTDSSSDNVSSTSRVENASTICEPHIKAAAERLASLKRVRSLVEPTDPQPKGEIDEEIARKHDEVLAKIWDIVDEYK